jgi:hypothetical protein
VTGEGFGGCGAADRGAERKQSSSIDASLGSYPKAGLPWLGRSSCEFAQTSVAR